MLSSVWPSVHQCLTVMTASTALQDQLDELWYQHSPQLQNSQGDLSNYLAGLTQLGHLLPVVLELLVDIREGCSFPILHNMTLQESVSLELHLLVRHHQASEAVRNLLEEAAGCTTNCIQDIWQGLSSLVVEASDRHHCSQAQLAKATFQEGEDVILIFAAGAAVSGHLTPGSNPK
ncbi:TPA: hypothetical protein ACH3X1_011825 [Trebouxia sp. C0004]